MCNHMNHLFSKHIFFHDYDDEYRSIQLYLNYHYEICLFVQHTNSAENDDKNVCIHTIMTQLTACTIYIACDCNLHLLLQWVNQYLLFLRTKKGYLLLTSVFTF